MLDSQVRSLPITHHFPCNDSGLQNRAPLYAAFMAARILLQDINHDARFYTISPPRPIPQRKRRFPNIEGLYRIPSSDKQEPERLKFQIEERLSNDEKGRFVYAAMTCGPDPKMIVVKFTRKYGKDLHEFCAAQNFAPKLLAYERLPGDWIGVAMETKSSLCHVMDSKFYRECGEQWLEDMDAMVAQIHEHGYVHGNLVLRNFMVDGKKLILVDFDWGDQEGKAEFPDINLPKMLRHGRDDVMITKAHDNRVLDITKQELQKYLHLDVDRVL